MWWILAYGGGNGKTVAELEATSSLYRLDYSSGGDPPSRAYELYECKPIAWWCREIGSMRPNFDGYTPVASGELLVTGDTLTIVIDHVTIAHYDGVRLECLPIDDLWCSDR